jgi:hypothetical protein
MFLAGVAEDVLCEKLTCGVVCVCAMIRVGTTKNNKNNIKE